jgi:23S rRNA pseudouridine2605 synthase
MSKKTDVRKNMQTIRLNKTLADAGVASRRGAEILIAQGRVQVNGVVADTPALQISADDMVTVDGQAIARAEKVRLWRYYKPVGLVCTHSDPEGRPTVFSALPEHLGRVISVGRLDVTSEGLLLLTNSGDLARQMELPASGLKRTYRVRVFGKPTEGTLKAIRAGVTIDGVEYRPAEVVTEGKGENTSRNVWLTMSLTEGKNREIRRIFEYFGHPVSRLIRVSYGQYQLGDMAVGEVREEKLHR